MSSEVAILNASKSIIGYLRTNPDGTQVILNSHHSIKGYYYPSRNITVNQSQSTIGYGNLLVSLIM